MYFCASQMSRPEIWLQVNNEFSIWFLTACILQKSKLDIFLDLFSLVQVRLCSNIYSFHLGKR